MAAYLARLEAALIPAYVIRRGDATAGAVLVKCARLDGTATALMRRYDFESDRRLWEVVAEGPEAEIDQRIASEQRADPDLWVIELENRDGRTLLEEEGLS